MTDKTQKQTVTLQELMVSNSGDVRRYRKAVDREGCLTDAEFKAKLDTERTNYLAVLKRLH